MPDRKLVLPLVAFLFFAAALSAALILSCDDGEDGDQTATPTAAPTVTPRATATAPPQDIRDVDLSEQADVQAMLRRVGGEIVAADVVYHDLTEDGREDAVVPVSSGGTAGNLAFLVLSYQDGRIVSILSKVPESSSLRLSIEDDRLVETQPVYGEGDLPGFPREIRNIYYKWDGEKLVVEREETTPSPHAPPKR